MANTKASASKGKKSTGGRKSSTSAVTVVTTGIAVLDYAVDAAKCMNICCMDTDKYYSSTSDATIMSFSRHSAGNLSPQLINLISAVESGKVHRQAIHFKKTYGHMVKNYARISKIVVSPYAVVVHATLHLTRGTFANANIKLPANCTLDMGGRLLGDCNIRTKYVFTGQDFGLTGRSLRSLNKKAVFNLIVQQIIGQTDMYLLPPTNGTFEVEFNNYTGAEVEFLSEKEIKNSKAKYCKKAVFELRGAKANPSGIVYRGSTPSGVTLVTQQTPSNKMDWYFSDCLSAIFSCVILSFVTKIKL